MISQVKKLEHGWTLVLTYGEHKELVKLVSPNGVKKRFPDRESAVGYYRIQTNQINNQ